jgi:hypothetical protein
MVNWVTTYKKITTKNILSWGNAWVQDLAQYYCFGMVKINRKADPKPMPQWVADHFWKSTNSFVGNMLPERYWSDYLEHFADDDPTTLKEDPTTEVMSLTRAWSRRVLRAPSTTRASRTTHP